MQSLNTNLMKQSVKAGRRIDFFFQYFVMFLLIILCVFQYNIRKIYGFSIYPDEFGYWACAAEWLHYDWSEVASLGSYYSFGYSLILTPILWLCKDGLTAYRIAIFINVVLQCISMGLLWKIFSKISLQTSNSTNQKMQILFATGVAVFYPAWSFYTQMTLAEALLTFLYILICYLLFCFLEKPKGITLVVLVCSFLYIHFVHMRTIGIILAAVGVMLLYAWNNRSYRKRIIATLLLCIIAFSLGMWCKEIIQQNVFALADTSYLNVNDYAGQSRTLQTIFTIQGFKQLLFSICGKLYYLAMASFGLLYPAVGYLIQQSVNCLRYIVKKEIPAPIQWLSLFLLLSIMGQLLISSIYMMNPGRLDGIVYGRYNDFLVPIVMGIGVLTLSTQKKSVKQLLVALGTSTVLFALSFYTMLQSDATAMQGYFAAGISYLSNDYHYEIVPEFSKAYLFGILLICGMYLCIYVGKKSEKIPLVMGTVLLVEIALMMCLGRKYSYYFGEINYQDLKVYEYINTYETSQPIGSNDEVRITYLYRDELPFIDLIQFMLLDNSVSVIKEADIAENKPEWNTDFLILDSKSEYLEEWKTDYEECIESENFVLFRMD
ncbi:MAG: hypothetical protein PUD93_10765 [Lachnospiraceae bacterium]|nr:hypothetical protein [Lachnospiraceae bacterium]